MTYQSLKVPPEKHELETARFFAERGHDIEFIQPSHIPEVHRPDIRMGGVEWEIKCPKGNGKHTIIRNLKHAAKQSSNVIVDLRRISIPEKECVAQIENRIKEHTSIRRVLIIKKDGTLVECSHRGTKTLIDISSLYGSI